MYIVDRLEGIYVVLEKEDKTLVNMEKKLFPPEVKAGDVVYEQDGRFYINKEETGKRSERIRKLMDSLWEE